MSESIDGESSSLVEGTRGFDAREPAARLSPCCRGSDSEVEMARSSCGRAALLLAGIVGVGAGTSAAATLCSRLEPDDDDEDDDDDADDADVERTAEGCTAAATGGCTGAAGAAAAAGAGAFCTGALPLRGAAV
jgi:hypothetical protein